MKFIENVPLAQYTTFKIGGPARFFCSVSDEKQLVEAVKFAKKKKLPIFILGGGSNVLVSDDGFNGLVIRNEMRGMGGAGSGNIIASAAGENWDDLVKYTVEHNLCGLENLSAIPGTVGAAPVQNIGAYGVDVSSVIKLVRALDTKEMKFVEFGNKECQFEYRDSLFKKEKGRYVITAVSFELTVGGKPNISYRDLREYFAGRQSHGSEPKTEKISLFNPLNWFHARNDKADSVVRKYEPSIADVRDVIIEIRANKLPDWKHWGTAGSYFKNPVVSREKYIDLKGKYPELSAFEYGEKMKIHIAWIIENVCKMKGLMAGNVGVYDKQALVLVAKPGAVASEIVSLANNIMKCVKEKTGIELESEVQWVN